MDVRRQMGHTCPVARTPDYLNAIPPWIKKALSSHLYTERNVVKSDTMDGWYHLTGK